MNLEAYKDTFNEEDAVGWESLDKRIDAIYPKQEPRHLATVIKYMLGGPDPIDGTSIYDSDKQTFHRHLTTYGMSELYYNEKAAGGDFSKWGFEFTFRLKTENKDDPDPEWIITLLNNLARYVFESGRWFDIGHHLSAGGPINPPGLETKIYGFVFTVDPELGVVNTPHGEVKFLQMVGITEMELARIQSSEDPNAETMNLIEDLKKENPLLITDMNRE